MDGAYIKSDQIQVEDIDGFAYSEIAITGSSVERVTKRNNRKQNKRANNKENLEKKSHRANGHQKK